MSEDDPATTTPAGARHITLIVAFFGLLLPVLSGLFLFVWTLANVVPEWRVNHYYVEGQCVVLDERVLERIEPDQNKTFNPEILIQYTVEGLEYEAWSYDATGAYTNVEMPGRVLDDFATVKEFACWYNLSHSGSIVLFHGYTWWTYGTLLALAARAFYTREVFGMPSERLARNEARCGTGSLTRLNFRQRTELV